MTSDLGLTLAVAVASCIAGWLCSLAARQIAHRFGIVNAPNPIVVQHRLPIAYLGGLGVAFGAAAALAGSLAWSSASPIDGYLLRVVALPGVGFLAIGLLDDLVTLSTRTKLVAQAAGAAAAVFLGLPNDLTPLPAANWFMSFSWILLVVNAANVTDVCDGLLPGLAVVGLTAVAVADPELRVLATALAGASLGFLVLNRPPASIFLGDAGSHLLGYVIAALGLLHLHTQATAAAAGLGVLIVAVPLFEVALLIVARRRMNLPVLRGSPDHFALRLQACGYTRWQVDGLAWAAALAACALGLALTRLHFAAGAVGIGVTAVVGLLLGRALLETDCQRSPGRGARVAPSHFGDAVPRTDD